LHQDPYLKTEKPKREPIPIPIIKTVSRKPNFKTKPKRKRVIASLPLIKREASESESETDSQTVNSKYINNVLRRNDPTFGVCHYDPNGSFKIGWSSFKCNYKRVFVDGRKYKATHAFGNC